MQETYRTKHDWQRHEKSLHLPLEQWICCPKGPRALNPDNNQVCCVFDGVTDPDNAHIESHNYTSCQERSLEERTFYRKDHLRQHLKLVHGAKFNAWAMNSWKVPTPDIRSRCGFCGIVLNSWSTRADHLAEHFKTGSTMVDWKGDWGFEPSVLSTVENAIPPCEYLTGPSFHDISSCFATQGLPGLFQMLTCGLIDLIHDERVTPLPFKASEGCADSPRNAYELIKLELAYWLQDRNNNVAADEILLETCRIIYAAEIPSNHELTEQASWFRDLLLSSEDTALQARMGPIRCQAENCLAQLKVNGKDNIFDDCPLEKQLLEFVKARTLLGLTANNEELQIEACNIVGRMEECSPQPSEHIANFILRLIHKDTAWLQSFRQRAGLLPMDEAPGPVEKAPFSASIQSYTQLESELADFANHYRATVDAYPSDEELRKHARCVVYKCQDDWQQTAANNRAWLESFKQRHFEHGIQDNQSRIDPHNSLLANHRSDNPGAAIKGHTFAPLDSGDLMSRPQSSLSRQNIFYLNSSCYRRLAWELDRFVTAAMSPNNPNQHVPTDEELKHQARWIQYDE